MCASLCATCTCSSVLERGQQAHSHVSQIAQSKQSPSKKKKKKRSEIEKEKNRKQKKQKEKKPSQSAKSWMILLETPVHSAACDCCSAACYGAAFCTSEVYDGDVHDILQATVILCYPLNLFARASLNICVFCRLFLLSISQFPSLFLLLSVF